MPLTPAEKMRRHRQKLKDEGKYEGYKKKHKETMQKSRSRKAAELEKLPLKLKKKNCKRNKRKCAAESCKM